MKTLRFNKLTAKYALFGDFITVSGQDLYTNSTVAVHPLGAIGVGNNGELFRYSLVGASNLVTGNLLQESAENTAFENMAVLASPVILPQNGMQTVSITNGATTVVASEFQGGSVSVYTTPDLGKNYTVIDNTADAVGNATLTVTLDRQLGTAWTTLTKVTLKHSPWYNVIQFPTTQTGIPVGVALFAATAANYCWVQTHGIATVLSDNSTFAVGSSVGTSLATAGAVGVNVAGTTHANVGTARQANASGHGINVFLQID